MKLTDERRKALTEYLGECWHKYKHIVPKSDGGYYDFVKCKKCGDACSGAYGKAQRTFTTDADMMAMFRKLTDTDDFNPFYSWAMWKHTYWSVKNYEEMITFLFYDPKRFCELVGEWLEEIKTWPCGESQRPKSQDSEE